MRGGGGGGASEEDKRAAEERHQANLALQKEQMEAQKRQFELTRQENKARYEDQKKAANAAPPPPPEKTAAVAAPAIDSRRAVGAGRKDYRSKPKAPTTASTSSQRSTAHSAKSLYIPS